MSIEKLLQLSHIYFFLQTNFQTYYIFHNFSNFLKNLSYKMKNVSIKLEIIYSIVKRGKRDGCALSFSFQDVSLGWWTTGKKKKKKNTKIYIYIFPLNIEILRASLELFDAGSANPVNFTAQVSMIAESTVYPFFSVPLGKRKFPGRGRESWFRLEGERNFRGRVSSTRLIRIRGRGGGGGARLSRVEPMKITAKRKVERSFPIMEPGRVATCWPQLHWKLIST